MIPIALPVVVIILGGASYLRRKPAPSQMTPDQLKVYRAAISGSLKDPNKLRKLSDAFAGEGFIPEARLLRQRARLRELPSTTKKK